MSDIEKLAKQISKLKDPEIDQLADLIVENSSRRGDRLQSSIGWVLFDKEHKEEMASESIAH